HEEPAEGAHRQQVNVGRVNVITLRDVNDPTNSSSSINATFDKKKYSFSDDPILSLSDSNGNVDPDKIDVIHAGIKSEKSDPIFITISLNETGVNTGTFEGQFSLSRSVTNDITDTLEAGSGDEFTVFYVS